MRTDDLIRSLLADQGTAVPSVERQLALALVAGFVVSALLFWAVLAPRPDVAAAAMTLRFDLKIVETLLLAATAGLLVLRLARPGAQTRARTIALLAAPVLLLAAVAVELTLVPRSQWMTVLVGSNSLLCLSAIPLLSLPLRIAALYALRQGAPTRPALTGAVAGLLAGGLAAALYAVHCFDDSPLFVATWYSLAIALVTLIGARVGRRVLRW
jgi:hypothetical protein